MEFHSFITIFIIKRHCGTCLSKSGINLLSILAEAELSISTALDALKAQGVVAEVGGRISGSEVEFVEVEGGVIQGEGAEVDVEEVAALYYVKIIPTNASIEIIQTFADFSQSNLLFSE